MSRLSLRFVTSNIMTKIKTKTFQEPEKTIHNEALQAPVTCHACKEALRSFAPASAAVINQDSLSNCEDIICKANEMIAHYS